MNTLENEGIVDYSNRAHSWIGNNIMSLIMHVKKILTFSSSRRWNRRTWIAWTIWNKKKKELNKIYSPNAKQKKLDNKRLIQRGQKEKMTKERLQGSGRTIEETWSRHDLTTRCCVSSTATQQQIHSHSSPVRIWLLFFICALVFSFISSGKYCRRDETAIVVAARHYNNGNSLLFHLCFANCVSGPSHAEFAQHTRRSVLDIVSKRSKS